LKAMQFTRYSFEREAVEREEYRKWNSYT